MTPEEKMQRVEEMLRKQGGFGNIADIRRAAGLKAGEGLATRMEKAGRLLHVAHDLYKLPTTQFEIDMAKRDASVACPKVRRGRGSY